MGPDGWLVGICAVVTTAVFLGFLGAIIGWGQTQRERDDLLASAKEVKEDWAKMRADRDKWEAAYKAATAEAIQVREEKATTLRYFKSYQGMVGGIVESLAGLQEQARQLQAKGPQ